MDWEAHESRDEQVTIGIGALCNRGTIAVVASDMRATFPRSNIEPNDMAGKQWDFNVSFPIAACVAGTLGLCQPVVDELSHRMSKLPRPVYCEHIENAIRDARFHIYQRYVDSAIRMQYGMTLREWQRGKVPGGKIDRFIHDAVRSLIDDLGFVVELIVVGFLPDGNVVFYKASGRRHVEASTTPGVYVIGSGGQLAMGHLNKRGQNIDQGLPRTMLHISEALDEAQKVADDSVGKPQAFVVMDRNGLIGRIDADAQVFKDWKAAYRDRETTLSLDSSVVAHEQIKALIQKHVVKRSTPETSMGQR